ncbi:hypothetical protein RFI_14764 [Reticulomyxa filosa]|uniref:Uncharacterized protein n=1 Tax=Reticulomyxa filosa TaxID=46433 RepID=X6N839_RETFI|nr:hypothetical protein RFI_14764 [Reticulomyxa filosa]|eukprot:ETO22435.1 hypothetical protein RFI_14764 [Reticulomyxa filosa]
MRTKDLFSDFCLEIYMSSAPKQNNKIAHNNKRAAFPEEKKEEERGRKCIAINKITLKKGNCLLYVPVGHITPNALIQRKKKAGKNGNQTCTQLKCEKGTTKKKKDQNHPKRSNITQHITFFTFFFLIRKKKAPLRDQKKKGN